MKRFVSKKDLKYLGSIKVCAEIDRDTLLWELKYQLKYINGFVKKLKSSDFKIKDISAGFYIIKSGFVDMLKKFNKQVNSASVVKDRFGAITDPKRIILELRTLFQLPLKSLIDQIKSNTIEDYQIINYLESFIDTAKVWQDRTQW
jgi:hypothetical protein